jgi:uncharacterized circularly permuted ATP-grasp superfamily protein
MLIQEYKTDSFFDEMVEGTGKVRMPYISYLEWMQKWESLDLSRKQSLAETMMRRRGITFNLSSSGKNSESIMPFDIIPRIIPSKEWVGIRKGLTQRIQALNMFIHDLYHDRKVIKDGIIPSELIDSSPQYLDACMGVNPALGIWIHISGTDLIRGIDGNYMVLEDNLRCPSGVSYVLENRELMKTIFPELFVQNTINPVSDYPLQLLKRLKALSKEENPTVAVWTPGPYNSAYYEHSFLATQMGVYLVEGKDLFEENDFIYIKTTTGKKKIDVLYRRIDDTFIDPTVFRSDSVLGVPGLFRCLKKGNLAMANFPGTGVADDKAVYAYVPKLIRYYLSEEPILENVPTYICSEEEDRMFVLEHLSELVVKAVDGAGGYGMLMGPFATKEEIIEFRGKIEKNPRKYIAQPVVSLSRVPTWRDGIMEGRHVDLRPFTIWGEDPYVLPGGLTRVALKKGSLVVNSSQGGGSKDTWVIDQ